MTWTEKVRLQRQFMTPNPYAPTETNTPVEVVTGPTWSFRTRVFFLLASVPAILLPVAYFTAVGWGILKLITDVGQRPVSITILVWTGFYATFIQLPIYLIWTLISHELTVQQRFIWFAIVFLLNMLTIPAFLFAKYRGLTVKWVSRSDRMRE